MIVLTGVDRFFGEEPGLSCNKAGKLVGHCGAGKQGRGREGQKQNNCSERSPE